MKRTKASNSVHVKGLFRVQLTEGGKVVGDSGWRKNTIVNDGFNQYLCLAIASNAGSKSVSHMGIGTGTGPAVTDTTLANELALRVTTATSTTASKTATFTALFASSTFSTQGAKTIQNIGLFNSSSGGTLFAGSTYATSQWQTNQNLNATYQISFS
jgi:hypothetical protein